MLSIRVVALAGMIFATTSSAATAFSISFEWGDIRLCTSGRPNTVSNPIFTLSGVPENAARIRFRMTDLDVPSYNHGGGVVNAPFGGTIEPGAFRYKSPCPPSGSHTYEWTAIAIDAAGTPVAAASAQANYP